MTNIHVLIRESLNQSVNPEEERAYLTWWASRATEQVVAGREFFEGQYQLRRSLKALQDRQIPVTDPQVQALVGQWRALAYRCRARESVLVMLAWNPTIARKVMDAGGLAMERDLCADQAVKFSARDYFLAALDASPWGKSIGALLQETHALEAESAATQTAAMHKIATRLRELCAYYELCDGATYAAWAAAMTTNSSRDRGGLTNLQRQRAWQRVVDAVGAGGAQ